MTAKFSIKLIILGMYLPHKMAIKYFWLLSSAIPIGTFILGHTLFNISSFFTQSHTIHFLTSKSQASAQLLNDLANATALDMT
jgi:hypothetical protein